MRFFNLNGILQRGTRFLAGSDSILESDVAEPRKLTERFRDILRRVAAVEAKTPPEAVEMALSCPANGQVTLNHQLGCPVRWFVTHWTPLNEIETHDLIGWTTRSYSVGTPANAGGNVTVGMQFRMKTVRPIVGARLFWKNNAATAYTVRVKLWTAAGAVLATKDVAVQNDGFYYVYFDSPITSDQTGGDLYITMWETSGARFSFVNVITLQTNIEMGTVYRIVNASRNAAGDAVPSATSGANHYPIEPLFVKSYPGPHLFMSSSSDPNRLVLDSRSPGTAIVRVEPSQYPVS